MRPIRILKLFFISVVVFGVLIFCLSLLFPSTTYVSRAVNVKDEEDSLNSSMLKLYTLTFQDNKYRVKALQKKIDSLSPKDLGPMKEDEIVSFTYEISLGDTLLMKSPFSTDIEQGVALHKLENDTTAIQVFYKIHVPWYKPWKKFALMLNESKYGPSLDSAISRISKEF